MTARKNVQEDDFAELFGDDSEIDEDIQSSDTAHGLPGRAMYEKGDKDEEEEDDDDDDDFDVDDLLVPAGERNRDGGGEEEEDPFKELLGGGVGGIMGMGGGLPGFDMGVDLAALGATPPSVSQRSSRRSGGATSLTSASSHHGLLTDLTDLDDDTSVGRVTPSEDRYSPAAGYSPMDMDTLNQDTSEDANDAALGGQESGLVLPAEFGGLGNIALATRRNRYYDLDGTPRYETEIRNRLPPEIKARYSQVFSVNFKSGSAIKQV